VTIFAVLLVTLLYNADLGTRKGKKNVNFTKWKRCAKLAIAWNSCEIARHSIFNTENRSHWHVSRTGDRSYESCMVLLAWLEQCRDSL